MAGRRGRSRGEKQVAVVSRRGRFAVAEPIFERGGQIALKDARRVKPGRMALVESAAGKARAVRDLGDPAKARDVIEALLVERGVKRGFSKALEEEAKRAAASAREKAGKRADLRDLPTFTVDPATARDFDDAVSAKPEGDGVRLWIHIADVAAHVKPGTSLEAEAYRRSTSTYVPGSVEPMLPAGLSAGACSLSPGDERLAVTTEMELSGSGEPRRVRFYRSRIRSDARLSYDQLDEIFAGRQRPPQRVAKPLKLTRRAAAALVDRRASRSLEVSTSEPEFSFTDGDIAGAKAIEQTEAHRLIEQLMIITNERVAEMLERKRVPSLYRVHEQPDPQRIVQLTEQLAALDIPTPPLPKRISPRQAGELAIQASRMALKEARRRGHGREAYTSLVLRSLKQAVYSDRNLGHAGLGSPAYAHFTSPIRRYPDLVAHRALLSVIGDSEARPTAEQVREAGPFSSEREREAMRIERDADDICAAFLLERELFEAGPEARFEGEVSGLAGAGAFIRFAGQLADVYEGFLPARVMPGDRFDLDVTETMLVGRRTGRRLRFGDPVTVTVERIETPRGRVDLAPVEGSDG